MNTLKAFTLVELLAVMAIIAIMFAVGITSLVALRESSKMNKEVNAFAADAKTLKSNARNNVFTPDEVNVLQQDSSCSTISDGEFAPDAVGLFFNPETSKPERIKCLATSLSTSADYCCVTTNQKSTFYGEDPNINYGADCDGVIFEYATGEAYRFNPSGNAGVTISPNSSTSIITSKESCTVNIHHKQLSFDHDVIFDTQNGTIDVK